MSPHVAVELCARIKSLRKEMFDLTSDLRSHCFAGDQVDVFAAAVEMQSVANRLGTVEAALALLTHVG